jgi:hypothetical protein
MSQDYVIRLLSVFGPVAVFVTLVPNVLMEAKEELDPGEREAIPVISGLTECVTLEVFLGADFFLTGGVFLAAGFLSSRTSRENEG